MVAAELQQEAPAVLVQTVEMVALVVSLRSRQKMT
jgi:hypothetical protein